MISDGRSRLLLDATRDVGIQLAEVEDLDGVGAVDAVVLTHGHRDASAGVRWMDEHGPDAGVTVLASPQTIRVLRGRYGPLPHLDVHEVEPGDETSVGAWTITAVEVPHANRPRFRTYAWRLSNGFRHVVYASDVGKLTDELRHLAEGSDLLVLDGAMYGQRIFSHLRIEEAVPAVCEWEVARILLTQIGRTAPPHEELERIVADLCPRAAPAYDGMELEL